MEENKEDLGVKIGTKEEAFWTGIKEQAEKTIKNSKAEIMINERIIILADEMILKEK